MKTDLEQMKNDEEPKYPRKVDRKFITESKGFIKKREEPVEELKEFVLQLMKNNGHTDWIEGVQAGKFLMKTESGNQEKSILLTPNKLTTLNYGGQYYKGWIAHEDNMSPYPQDPIHDGEMYEKTTQKIAMNYRDANEAKYLEAKAKMWIYIFVGGAILLYIIYIIGKKVGWFGGAEAPMTQAAVATAKIAIQNTTGVRVE